MVCTSNNTCASIGLEFLQAAPDAARDIEYESLAERRRIALGSRDRTSGREQTQAPTIIYCRCQIVGSQATASTTQRIHSARSRRRLPHPRPRHNPPISPDRGQPRPTFFVGARRLEDSAWRSIQTYLSTNSLLLFTLSSPS